MRKETIRRELEKIMSLLSKVHERRVYLTPGYGYWLVWLAQSLLDHCEEAKIPLAAVDYATMARRTWQNVEKVKDTDKPLIHSGYLWDVGATEGDPNKIYEDENGQALVLTSKEKAEQYIQWLLANQYNMLEISSGSIISEILEQ